MRPTLRLGRIRGIDIGVHWSLLVIGALLVTTLAGSLLPDLVPDAGGSYWAAAIIATALFFASILAHELSHALVARRRGQRVEDITLWMFGGVARLRDEARDARSELYVAVAGPAMSIALGIVFVLAGLGLDAIVANGSLLPAVAIYVGIVNVVLALFNLLPGAPLDGGRILTAVLWAARKDRRRAQVVAARVGRVLGTLLIAYGLVGFVVGWGYGDIWTALVGWFVLDASRSEELAARVAGAIDDHAIGELMGPPPAQLPEWTTVEELRAGAAGRMPSSIVLLGFSGTPTALLQTGAFRAVTDDRAGTARLHDFAIAIDRVPRVTPDTPARAALELGIPVLVAVGDQIVGVVSLDDVRRAARTDAVTFEG